MSNPTNPPTDSTPSAPAQLFYRVKPVSHGKVYEIFHGDPKNIYAARYLGYVSQTMDGLNRLIDMWTYEVAEDITVTGKKWNLNAGNTMKKAAIRLAHKCGVAMEVKA